MGARQIDAAREVRELKRFRVLTILLASFKHTI